MENSPQLETLLEDLGEFGVYQLKQHALHAIPAFLAGLHMMALTFTAPVPESRCFIPQVNYSTATEETLSKYIPLNAARKLDSCSKFRTAGNVTYFNEMVSCEGRYLFNSTYYAASRVIEWNMVCDRKWMRAFLQSVYMLGLLSGNVLTGSLADIFGRKPILCFCGILEIIFATACAFIPSYKLYALFLFLYGTFGSNQAYGASFVMTMELVGVSKRNVCGNTLSAINAGGIMLAAFWAWLIPDANLLQIVFALHSCLLLGHWWLSDESFRWLWSKGRKQEAIEILSRAIETNKKGDLECASSQNNLTKTDLTSIKLSDNIPAPEEVLTEKKPGTIAELMNVFGLPNLRARTLIFTFCQFANSLAYFALSFSAGSLPGNPFLMCFLIGLAELPGLFIVTLLLDRVGRRWVQFFCQLITGIACIVIGYISQNNYMIAVAMVAKMAAAAAGTVTSNYTAEMFPTVARNFVMGIISMAASIAGMLAPEIIMLDEYVKTMPAFVYGSFAISAAVLTLFLPETMNKELPQIMEDGEKFGKGDNAFVSVATWISSKKALP